jgi:hypothetical protein
MVENTEAASVTQMPAPAEHIMQFFAYAHLPPTAQEISRPFGELAERMVAQLPRNPERTVALRKLLESKDAAVRAFIAK